MKIEHEIYESWIREALDLKISENELEDYILKAHFKNQKPTRKELIEIRDVIAKILSNRHDIKTQQEKIKTNKKQLVNLRNSVSKTPKELTLEELRDYEIETKEEVQKILLDPNFFDRLVKEVQKKVVHEEDTIKTILLCACGRLVENAKKTSYNLIVNSVTGAGKDWVVERTLEIIPKKDWVKRTRITEKVFTYWHNPKFEPEWTWDGKVFYNEDISNAVLNSDVFKVMSSTGSIATVLVNQKPVDIEIVGTPVMIVTTESANPSKEIIRRFSIVFLDESIDQSEAIMAKKLELAKLGKTLEYDEKLIKAQELLKRIKVKIPFANKLKTIFPMNKPSHILMRTHIDRFLDFIKSSCALHQFQRKVDEEGYYLAQPEDYENARIVLQKITSNPFMIPLTKDEQKIIDTIRELPKGKYSAKDLEKYITFVSDRTLIRKLKKLANYGLLKVDSEYRDDIRRYVIVYEFEPFNTIKIPKYEELLNSDIFDNIDNVDNVDNSVAQRQQRQNCQPLLMSENEKSSDDFEDWDDGEDDDVYEP